MEPILHEKCNNEVYITGLEPRRGLGVRLDTQDQSQTLPSEGSVKLRVLFERRDGLTKVRFSMVFYGFLLLFDAEEVVFRHQPLGLDFSGDDPMVVQRVHRFSQAEEAQVEPNWAPRLGRMRCLEASKRVKKRAVEVIRSINGDAHDMRPGPRAARKRRGARGCAPRSPGCRRSPRCRTPGGLGLFDLGR